VGPGTCANPCCRTTGGFKAELPDVAVRWTGSVTWAEARGRHETQLGAGRFWIGGSEIAALEPNLRNPPERAIHTPGDGGVDPWVVTNTLVDGARAHGATVVSNSAVVRLKTAGARVEGVEASTGFHAAEKVVLAAGTGTPELCEPLLGTLPVTASPACLARVAAPVGLVKTIVAGPDFEVREVRDGDLLLTVPPAAGASATGSGYAVHEALRRLQAAFHGSDSCRLTNYRIGRRPMPAAGPLIGDVTRERSVYVAVTHSAITLAPTIGRLVAEELVTGRPVPELRRCRPREAGPLSPPPPLP
jgi:glycine/D-amino acid oxidase-like deaminating enzyme